jgi:hypothetical protein
MFYNLMGMAGRRNLYNGDIHSLQTHYYTILALCVRV